MDPALWSDHPLSGVHVDERPCETCEGDGDQCPPGWREVGGRLQPEHLGVGKRCPKWRPVGGDAK